MGKPQKKDTKVWKGHLLPAYISGKVREAEQNQLGFRVKWKTKTPYSEKMCNKLKMG